MSEYDKELQDAGLCGHICPAEGPFHTFHCTRPADHILDGEPLHQAIQLGGPIEGRINGAWHHDGTSAMEPVDMTPTATCGLEQPIDPETLDKVNQRIAVVSDKVDMLVLDYQASNSGDTAKDMLKNCTSLVASFEEQTADPHEAMQLACEALAVAVQKLAFASWQEEMFMAEQKKVRPTGDNSGGIY
jgi:hypothetical protein